MTSRSPRPVVVLVVGVAMLAVSAHAAHDLARAQDVSRPTQLSFPTLLALAALVLAIAATAWLLLVVVLTQLGPSGRRLARMITPRLLRGAVLAGVCGVLAVAPSHAAPPETGGSTRAQGALPLDGLRLPDRTATSPAPGRSATSEARDEVVVQVGDSLWRIAERRAPGAKVAELAHDARQLHDLNRSVLGDHPDLIQPGQHLHLPQEHS